MGASRRREKNKKAMSPALCIEEQQSVARTDGNRSDRRFIVNQPAYVSCPSVSDTVWTARICDISRRGMQLMLEEAVPLGPGLHIEWNGREIRGTVRYQQAREGEYRVGVELSSSWETLLSDVLAQQTEELRQSNLALREAKEELVQASEVLREKNQELGRALEIASQASEVKSRFLASVSHEFRTPLNGIIGFSEMLHDAVVGPVSDDQKDCLSDILSCSRHLLTLINQVLDLTKIESGHMDFQYEDVELKSVAREVMEGMKGIAAGKRIVIGLESDEIGPVMADAARLRQILFNYLSNALKCTHERGSVSVRIVKHDSFSYRIEVEDTGVGIRAEDIPRLFTEFGQLVLPRRPNREPGWDSRSRAGSWKRRVAAWAWKARSASAAASGRSCLPIRNRLKPRGRCPQGNPSITNS